MRRQFDLPSFDTQFLGTTGLEWETIIEGAGRWLLLHERPVPSGYNVERILVALQIPPGYPDAEIDMAYFHPHLSRKDGKPIGALSGHNLDGKSYQRWSRHRNGTPSSTEESKWRPGEDGVFSHLVLVDDWLAREFQLR